jgi:glycosyltransferase involved in cell wall biosynthesis
MSQNQKTILHVIDTTGPGGAETVFIDLADKLRDQGYRSIALIRGKGWVYEELKRRNIDTHIIECKGSFNVGFLRKLVTLIKIEKVEIIQSHLLGSNIYCAMAGVLSRKPVFATFHGAVDVAKQERFLKLKCLILNLGITKFIAVSKTLKDEIKASGLLSERKTTVIYNGIDTTLYYKRDSSPIRKTLGLEKSAILVGSLGNVRPAKAYDVLIKAAAIAVREKPELHFVIAGDTKKEPLMSELNELINKENIAVNVHFIGFQDNSADFLGQMDIFLLSSSSEGFSISTIEAMATGLPIIATKCGGPEEIIENITEGTLVEVNNPLKLSQALVKQTISKVEIKNFRFSSTMLLLNYRNLYSCVT